MGTDCWKSTRKAKAEEMGGRGYFQQCLVLGEPRKDGPIALGAGLILLAARGNEFKVDLCPVNLLLILEKVPKVFPTLDPHYLLLS